MKLKLWRSLLLKLCLSNAIVYAALKSAPQVTAQISPDGTTNTNVNTTDNVINIEGGDRGGVNLFHSLEEFSVPNGSEAFFNNANDIANIFSRVTGGDLSNIDGLIRANGDASLFLINPAGIIFGEGAALDIGGSFTASTAESIVFTDDIEFSAIDATEPPLLTINQPLGLNFGNNPGDLAVEGSNLEVNNSETLALFGGNVTITGGQIIAPGANIELGGLTAAGQISFTQSENTFNSFSFPEGVARGNVTLTDGAEVNVRAAGGGSIEINARNLELSDASNLRTGIAPESTFIGTFSPDAASMSSDSTEAQAGNININATDDITLNQGSQISNRVEESGIGNASNIKINTDNLFLKDRGLITTSIFGEGNAGTIVIDASDTISIDGKGESSQFPSGIYSRAVGVGDSGGIDITTSNLSLTQGGRVNANTLGLGNAGAININASDTISVDGETSDGLSSFIESTVKAAGIGDSGGIEITTSNLSLTQGGRVSASTFGQGNAGEITIDASDTIAAEGKGSEEFPSGIYSRAVGVGDSQGIDLTTFKLSLTQGGRVSANTFGQGNAGEININASDTISVDGETSDGLSSFIESTVKAAGIGDSGGIEITTSNLSLTQGGRVSASTFGQGNAGEITIDASDTIAAEGKGSEEFPSGIYSRAVGVGDSQGIDLTTFKLSLTQGGRVSANTLGQGNAGEININASDTISVDGETPNGSSSFIETTVKATGVGDSGGIDIKTSKLSLTQGGRVSASTFGQGNAGEININASDTISVDGETPDGSSSFIESTVRATGVGDSGGIDIKTSKLSLTQGGRVSASTFGEGNAGEITIDASGNISVEGKGSEEFPSGIYSRAAGVGDSGGIDIKTSNFSLTKGGRVSANTLGQGNAGEININASDTISVDGETPDGSSSFIESTVRATGVGDSGGIDIKTSKLSLTQGGRVSASTFGEGNAGEITIDASGNISVEGKGSEEFPSGIYSRAAGVGDSGGIDIKTSNFSLTKGGRVSANTLGQGNAGEININASDTISVDGETPDGSSSFIESTVRATGVGDSGGIDIKTSKLSLTQGGRVSASTFGEGNAGEITIDASGNISVEGKGSEEFPSGIYSRAAGVGDSGGIDITTSNLFVTQGGRVSANTLGRGNAGTIVIDALDTISVDGGGLILATTFGQGDAGDLTVTASESIELVGSDGEVPSGFFANTIEGSGDGGNLTIATDKLIVRDEAVITAGNFQQLVGDREPRPPGTGAAGNLEINAGSVEVGNRGKITTDNANGIGGNLTLNADSMTLENEASVSASTIAEQGQGGIVTLDIDDSLILSDRSLISARADSGASGGNIDLKADFVIAQPNQNNDIIASATEGAGGDINITTNAIFGLEERSSTPPNNTNDIDASSEFGLDGTIQINELEVNPTEALEELPIEIIDVTGLVEQNLCQQGQGSEFVVTGKGGIAPSPTQARDGSVSEVDLVKPVPFSEVEAATQETREARGGSSEIVEAQGWVVNDRGMVELVASKTDIHSSPTHHIVQCHKQ